MKIRKIPIQLLNDRREPISMQLHFYPEYLAVEVNKLVSTRFPDTKWVRMGKGENVCLRTVEDILLIFNKVKK